MVFNSNKKTIISTILFLMSPESFANCKVPEKEDYQLIAAVMYSQLYLKQEKLLKKLCLPKEMNTRWEKGPVMMTTSVKGLLKIEEKVGQITDNFVDEFGSDLLSKNLLEEPKELKEITLIEIKDIIKKNYKDINVDDIKTEKVEKEKKVYLDFLAERYAQRTYISDNRYGNIALHYVISNNKSEYIKKALGKKEDYQLFLKENKNKIMPLHAMFALSLKDKNTKELNKIVIKLPDEIFKNAKINNISYLEFAEEFKNNNLEFYKLLKQRFNFNHVVKLNKYKRNKYLKYLNINIYDYTD